jgi:putative FmdB family regulatory protein
MAMPLHDYECTKCGKFFESVYQKFEEDPLTVCTACGEEALNKVFAVPTFFVKGEPTTIAQLAEKNTKTMGRYELEDKKAVDTKANEEQKNKTAMHRKINKMTPQQKANWIKGGD